MLRFLLTPRWLALHLVTVLVVVGFVALGWWQFLVYRDSQARHDERAAEPVPIDELVRAGEPLGDAADHQVIIEGTFLAEDQLLVPGRPLGDVLGSYVLTPLRTDDGTIVPVLRGWVDEPDDTATTVPDGPVRVDGYLLVPETPDHATVRSDRPLEDDQLGYIAPEPLAERSGLPAQDTVQGYLLLTGQHPGAPAAPTLLDVDAVAPIRDVNPWQNLSYWAQWWVFGAAVIVFWFSVVRGAVRKRRAGLSAPVESPAPS